VYNAGKCAIKDEGINGSRQGKEMSVYFGGRSYKKQRESAISSNMPLHLLTSIDVSHK
jgi:hypothetical protein